jgi:hypothetical protein
MSSGLADYVTPHFAPFSTFWSGFAFKLLNFCKIMVKNKKSSILAKISPAQVLGPVEIEE